MPGSDREASAELRERLVAAEAICQLVPSASTLGGWRFPDAPAEYARWRSLANRPPSIPDTLDGRVMGQQLALAEHLIECIDLVESSNSDSELREAGRWVLAALAAWQREDIRGGDSEPYR
jgi:hypothetical protein